MLFCRVWCPAGLCSAGSDTPQNFVKQGIRPRRLLFCGVSDLAEQVSAIKCKQIYHCSAGSDTQQDLVPWGLIPQFGVLSWLHKKGEPISKQSKSSARHLQPAVGCLYSLSRCWHHHWEVWSHRVPASVRGSRRLSPSPTPSWNLSQLHVTISQRYGASVCIWSLARHSELSVSFLSALTSLEPIEVSNIQYV